MTTSTKVLNVGLLGAGGVNFGCVEGPWNHSKRLESFSCMHDQSLNLPNHFKASFRKISQS